MNAKQYQQYRLAINKVKGEFGAIAVNHSVGVVVAAAMEIILISILSISDKLDALRATESLRPMIDHIESQIRGSH